MFLFKEQITLLRAVWYLRHIFSMIFYTLTPRMNKYSIACERSSPPQPRHDDDTSLAKAPAVPVRVESRRLKRETRSDT